MLRAPDLARFWLSWRHFRVRGSFTSTAQGVRGTLQPPELVCQMALPVASCPAASPRPPGSPPAHAPYPCVAASRLLRARRRPGSAIAGPRGSVPGAPIGGAAGPGARCVRECPGSRPFAVRRSAARRHHRRSPAPGSTGDVAVGGGQACDTVRQQPAAALSLGSVTSPLRTRSMYDGIHSPSGAGSDA